MLRVRGSGKFLRGFAVSAGCIVLALPASAQTGTLDQQSPMTNAGFNIDASSLQWQQQIRAGIAGQLEGVQLTIQGDAGAQFHCRVRLGDGWNTGPTVFDQLITKANNGNELIFIDMTGANINLAVNDTFVLETQGNDTGAGLVGNYVAPPGTPLYPEDLFLGGPGCFADCGWRHGFNTYMLAGGGTYSLDLSGSCPGRMTVSWSGASPNGQQGILFARGTGSQVIPPGNPCAGTMLGLNGNQLRLVDPPGFFGTGGSGSGMVSGNASQGSCGGYLQLIQGGSCITSNVEQMP